MNTTFYSNCEKEFLINSMAGKRRFDGRKLCGNQTLCWCFFFNKKNIVLIMIGKSLVQCFGSSEFLHNLSILRGNEGNCIIKGEINPLILSYFDLKRNKEFQSSTIKSFEMLLQENRFFKTFSLPLISDVINVLSISVNVINCDGIVIDMVSLSLFLFLNIYQPLMKIKIEHINHTRLDYNLNAFSLSQFPFCFSFGVIHNLSLFIHEPSYMENIVLSGKIVTGVNIENEIMSLKLIGPVTMSVTSIFQCCSIAFSELDVYRGILSRNFQQSMENNLVCNF